MTKGIVLAGGSGTRLYPLTLSTSKQLLPVYDKPMIYYPLSVLLMAQIKEILIISTPRDLPNFKMLLKDGSQFGVKFEYIEQPKPEGIAQAFILAENFIGKDSVCLILGDNIFYGSNMKNAFMQMSHHQEGGMIFCYEVKNPSRYGVVEFNEAKQIQSIIEKPKNPPSDYAVTGLYCYDHQVVEIAKNLKPSKRGELEITDVNNFYLSQGKLKAHLLERGFAWLDTGTHDALQAASAYVQTLQERQGIQVCCPEEIAFESGFISLEQLEKAAKELISTDYGLYLKKIVDRQLEKTLIFF